MKINSLLQEGITTSSSPDNAQSPAPHFGRSDKVLESENTDMTGKTCEKCKKGEYQETGVQDDMHGVLHCTKCGNETKRWKNYKEQVEESTTSGSVATVASPVGGVQRRAKGSIFSGIKTSDKFANSQAVKEETTDEGFLGFGSDAPAQPKKKLDYAAARRLSQQANPKMTKQYHPDEYIKKYGAFAEEDELDENSMADFFAKAAQEKFPNALIRKNGETIQEPPKREVPQQVQPQAPVDVAELERQYAALEKRYEQLGGDSWQYADRMMDRDYEARDVGRELRVLADRIQKAKGIEEAKKANTKTVRKGLAKREKRADPTMDAKKQSEQDAAWERLQAYMNKPENKEVLQRLATKEGVAEGEEMSTFAALKDWQVWNVHVYNNFYRGKYADYGPRLYSVVASSPEEARQVVINNPDYVLQDLLSRKLVSGKKVLPRGSALPIEAKRVGKAEPGTITTMAFKKMLTPDGVQSFKFTNGKIVDGAHVQGGEELDEAQWWPDREYIPKAPRKRKPQVGNRVADIRVGSPKIYYKNGKAVGEVGIDPEASPGNGSYYMKHYLSGRALIGYDTPLEASKELAHLVRQEQPVDENRGYFDGMPTSDNDYFRIPGPDAKHPPYVPPSRPEPQPTKPAKYSVGDVVPVYMGSSPGVATFNPSQIIKGKILEVDPTGHMYVYKIKLEDGKIASVGDKRISVAKATLKKHGLDEGLGGDMAKLIGIPVVAGAAAIGAQHYDDQQPHVQVGGQNAKIVQYGSSRIPDTAMLLKGQDGKMYRVWQQSGKGMNKMTLASPAEPVKEGLKDIAQKVKHAVVGDPADGPRKTMGLHASLEQHQDDMMKKVGHKFKGNYNDEANPIRDDGNEGVPGKQRYPGVAEGSETAADIDKKIEFHKQGQAAAQYKGSMNKMHAAKIRELEAKKKQQGVKEAKDDLSQYSTERLKAYVKKVSGGGVPQFGAGAQLKRVEAELKRRQQGVAEASKHKMPKDWDPSAPFNYDEWKNSKPKTYKRKVEPMGTLPTKKDKEQGVAEEQVNEKSVSKAQFRTMAAVAHNPKFAKKVGISQKVGKEFHKADKKSDYSKLPKKVDEAEIAEDKLASDLYKDLQIFKKGADKDIGNRPKDKDIGNKPSDKEVQKKK